MKKLLFALCVLVAMTGKGQPPTRVEKQLLAFYWDSLQVAYDRMDCRYRNHLDATKEKKIWWSWHLKWTNLFTILYPEIVRQYSNKCHL